MCAMTSLPPFHLEPGAALALPAFEFKHINYPIRRACFLPCSIFLKCGPPDIGYSQVYSGLFTPNTKKHPCEI